MTCLGYSIQSMPCAYQLDRCVERHKSHSHWPAQLVLSQKIENIIWIIQKDLQQKLVQQVRNPLFFLPLTSPTLVLTAATVVMGSELLLRWSVVKWDIYLFLKECRKQYWHDLCRVLLTFHYSDVTAEVRIEDTVCIADYWPTIIRGQR
jgi:hypothetical protein